MKTETGEVNLTEVLAELGSLSSREDALRLQARKLAEERREISAKLARVEEAVKASTLGGLREPPEELVKQAAELEERLGELNEDLAEIDGELDEIGHRRVKLLKGALPEAWRRVQEARQKAYSPELRQEALEAVREGLAPFVKAQEELVESEETLGALLRHAARVDQRAPSLLRQTLTDRHGAMPDPPSRDRVWRAVRTLVNVVGEAP